MAKIAIISTESELLTVVLTHTENNGWLYFLNTSNPDHTPQAMLPSGDGVYVVKVDCGKIHFKIDESLYFFVMEHFSDPDCDNSSIDTYSGCLYNRSDIEENNTLYRNHIITEILADLDYQCDGLTETDGS